MTPTKTPAQRARAERPVLVGRPQSLRGHVPIANSGDDDLFVSSSTLHADLAPGPVRVSGSTVVPAGGVAPLAVSVALDPLLPAGEYTAEVEVAGERHEVVLHVVENVDLDITPSRVYVTPDQHPIKATLVAANNGNVAVRLPAVATADAGAAGTLTVRIARTPTVLEPGESRALSVTVTPPADRDDAMRYDITLSIGPTDITVSVLPTADQTKTPPTAGGHRLVL